MVNLQIEGLGPGELIGGGGSAQVFAAHRLNYGDQVAVKVLRQTLTDAIARDHFEREARALGELADIPGIVGVLDAGVSNRGEPYLVFPLFDGSASAEIRAHGPMEATRAARIIEDVARAVHGGHQRGVIHRDIKPSNVLLTASDEGFIADFGIAKLVGTSMSASAWLGLTPAYSPPETLQGESSGVAGDVYGLGATLATLIIGTAPFASDEPSDTPIALVGRVISQPAPDLVAFGAPAEIAAVVNRAMAKEPAHRQQSALEFAEELNRAFESSDRTVDPWRGDRHHPSTEGPGEPTGPTRPEARHAPPAPSQTVPLMHAEPTRPSVPDAAETLPTSASPARTRNLAIGAAAALAALAIVAIVVSGLGRGNGSTPETVQTEAAVGARPTAVRAPQKATAVPTDVPVVAEPAPTVEPAPTPVLEADGPIEVRLDGTGDFTDLTTAADFAFAGDVIRLGPGTFTVPEPLTFTFDITIVGEGPDDTTIVFDSAEGLTFLNASGFLSDLTVTSTVQQQTRGTALVLFDGSPAMRVDNARITKAPGNGLGVLGATGSITNVTVDQNQLSGVLINSFSVIDISNTTAADNTLSGFILTDTPVVSITGSSATGHSIAGFQADGGIVTMIGNTASGNKVGFSMSGTTSVDLRGNHVDSSMIGYLFSGEVRGDVVANLVTNSDTGFASSDEAGVTLTANQAIDTVAAGFTWDGRSRGRATGNDAHESPFFVTGSAFPNLRANYADAQQIYVVDDTASPAVEEDGVIWVLADGTGDAVDLATAVAQAEVLDVIRLGAGVFEVDETLLITKELTIIGEGADQTILLGKLVAEVLNIDNVSVHLLNFTVRLDAAGGGDVSSTAIAVRGSKDFVIDNIEVSDTGGVGMAIVDSDGTVSNSQFWGNAESGLVVSGTSEATVVRSSFTDNGAAGLAFLDQATGIVAANSSRTNNQGMQIGGTAAPLVLVNTAEVNTTAGFEVIDAATPMLIGNTGETTGGNDFVWRGTGAGVASHNRSSNSLNGFAVMDQASPNLVSNTSTNNLDAGFVWSDDATGTAAFNLAHANDGDGFSTFDRSTPALTLNTSRENTDAAFAQNDSSLPELDRNTFSCGPEGC